ncbi:Hypothetical predicted protein [Pelobates cultripes]|uniref:Reverse transcriptase zinc-binding domain-containing protein n=1 Tax=Pelobates cultripes TaxID=61616 RepID=A0AAD1RYX2_PELCU|nr:Hypothetical predicted protein [Pelobates cultripes]
MDVMSRIIPTLNQKIWLEHDIKRIEQLYDGGKIMQFPALQTVYNLPSKMLFPYLQLKSCLQHTRPQTLHDEPLQELSTFEKICTNALPPKKVISLCYKALIHSQTNIKITYKHAWHKELNQTISEEHWTKAYSSHRGITSCTNHLELQRKILYRWYLVPERIHKIWPQSSTNQCWRCKQQVGTMLHTWWSCDIIQPFWRKVGHLIQQITNTNVEPTIEMCLLYIPPENLTRAQWATTYHILISTAMLIARLWKSPSAPNFSTLLNQINTNWQYESMLVHQRGLNKSMAKANLVWKEYWEANKAAHTLPNPKNNSPEAPVTTDTLK